MNRKSVDSIVGGRNVSCYSYPIREHCLRFPPQDSHWEPTSLPVLKKFSTAERQPAHFMICSSLYVQLYGSSESRPSTQITSHCGHTTILASPDVVIETARPFAWQPTSAMLNKTINPRDLAVDMIGPFTQKQAYPENRDKTPAKQGQH